MTIIMVVIVDDRCVALKTIVIMSIKMIMILLVMIMIIIVIMEIIQ